MKKMTERLREVFAGQYASVIQLIKFGFVGVSNSVIYFTVEILCYYVLFDELFFAKISLSLESIDIIVSSESIRVIAVTIIAFVISVNNSYFWNSRFVFKTKNNNKIMKGMSAFLRMTLCYGLTGLVFSPIVKIWLSSLGIAYWTVSFITLVLMVPLNFIINKIWAFRDKS